MMLLYRGRTFLRFRLEGNWRIHVQVQMAGRFECLSANERAM